jgi:hypothetical protein
MGILTRAVIKATEEAAERAVAKSAKSATRKAEAGVADAAHTASNALPIDDHAKPLGAEIEDGGTATRKTETKSTKEHSARPENGHHEQKSFLSPLTSGAGVLLIVAIVITLFAAAFRKRKGASGSAPEPKAR